jgi:Tol biopolymer transport system component
MSVPARAAALALLAIAGGCAAFAGDGSGASDHPAATDGGGSGSEADGAAPGDGSAGGDSALPVDAAGVEGGGVYPYEIVTDGKCDLTKPFQTPVLLDGLAPGAFDTLGGFFSSDYQTLYFGRGDATHDSIYVAKRSGAQLSFGNVMQMMELYSGTFDSSPNLLPNGLAMFFESERGSDGGAAERNIWSTSRATTTDAFGPPVLVTGINSDQLDEQPYLSPTGTTLYFASNRGGSANMDIWWTEAAGGNNYDSPMPVAEVNSAGNDFHPVLSPDLNTMYLASDRAGGMGDYDVYIATRPNSPAAPLPFSAPKLVPELNTQYKDEPTWISPDGCTMLLASTRPFDGDSSHANIYVTSKPRM